MSGSVDAEEAMKTALASSHSNECMQRCIYTEDVFFQHQRKLILTQESGPFTLNRLLSGLMGPTLNVHNIECLHEAISDRLRGTFSCRLWNGIICKQPPFGLAATLHY